MFLNRSSKDTKLELHASQYLIVIVFASLHFGHMSSKMGVDKANVCLV